MSRVVAIIPARYSSTRLPAKPLAMIGDTSMIVRVYSQTLAAKFFSDVIVATDDDRIFNHCVHNNVKVCMTNQHHLNGTTRCLEVAETLDLQPHDIILNVQGDEPFIQAEQLRLVVSCFDKDAVQIATLCKRIYDNVDNPNLVKLVKSIDNKALYFSRSAIPFHRDNHDETPIYYKHIGLYAYRFQVLKEITKLHESKLEKAEKLEQLRWLENGFSIHVKETILEALSVDTPDDLIKANEYLKTHS